MNYKYVPTKKTFKYFTVHERNKMTRCSTVNEIRLDVTQFTHSKKDSMFSNVSFAILFSKYEISIVLS